jgi:hypothetical protein
MRIGKGNRITRKNRPAVRRKPDLWSNLGRCCENPATSFCILVSWGGMKLSPLGSTSAITYLLYQPRMMDDDECGAVGGLSGMGNQSTWRKPPPQIPHDLTRARIWAAAAGSRRLTAWAVALRRVQMRSSQFRSSPSRHGSRPQLQTGRCAVPRRAKRAVSPVPFTVLQRAMRFCCCSGFSYQLLIVWCTMLCSAGCLDVNIYKWTLVCVVLRQIVISVTCTCTCSSSRIVFSNAGQYMNDLMLSNTSANKLFCTSGGHYVRL